MSSNDFNILSEIPVWFGDQVAECPVLLEPGPASFIFETPSCENISDDLDHDSINPFLSMAASGSFDEPLDISCSLDDLLSEGLNMDTLFDSDSFKNDVSGYDSWLDISASTSMDEDKEPQQPDRHECDSCPKSFKLLSDLTIHLERVHKKKKKGKFPQKAITGGKIAKCTFCLKTFSTKEKMDVHTANVHRWDMSKSKPSFSCKVCNAPTSTKAHLALHMLKEHSNAKKASVPQVVPSFSLESPGVNHPVELPKAAVVNKLNCGLCDETFFSRIHLESHTRMHTQEKPLGKNGLFSCGVQGCFAIKGFKTNSDLLNHVKSYHSYACTHCTQLFGTMSGLMQHKLKDHNLILDQQDEKTEDENEKPTVKPLGRSILEFLEKIYLQNVTASGGISCTFCRIPDIYANFNDFIAHFKENHPYRCPIGCQRFWKYRSSVRKHFNNHHKNEVSMHCEHCTDVFVSSLELSLHKSKYHNEVHKSPTPTNTKSMIQLAPSKLSISNKNPGIRLNVNNMSSPFKIQKPAVVTVKPQPAPVVVVKHKVESAFQCPKCEKSYHHPDSIRKHCRLIHKILVTNCRHCYIVFQKDADKSRHMEKFHAHMSKSPSQGSSPKKFRDSMPESSSERYYQCPVCEKQYLALKTLRRHCKVLHNLPNIYACRNCYKAFSSQESKDHHFTRYHKEFESSSNSIVESSSYENDDEGQELIVVVHQNGSTSPSSSEEFNGFGSPYKEMEKFSDKPSALLHPFKFSLL